MMAPLRVLVLEDSPDDATLIELELRRSGHALHVHRVWSAAAMRHALAAEGWDIVLSDWSMPFQIFLPRVDAAAAEPERPRRAPTSLRGSETILLCEDEDQVRAVTAGILRRAGYEVLVAASPTVAIEVAREGGHIDVLLTDVVMPVMSGPDLAQAVLEARPEIVVICMSGYIDDTITRHGVVDHGFGFVHKPLTPEPLLRKLRDVLDA